MKFELTGAIWLAILLAAPPALAQESGTATVQSDKPLPGKEPRVALPSAASQPPTAKPDEISHDAMVEEQERRDREEQAERDRDDQA